MLALRGGAEYINMECTHQYCVENRLQHAKNPSENNVCRGESRYTFAAEAGEEA